MTAPSGASVAMQSFVGVDAAGAASFCARWLPAWTGNDPERLVAFYTDDAFYSDPAVPDGVRGRADLFEYFRRLLARNPEWLWAHERSSPLPSGFVNHWRATIPIGTRTVTCRGVCLVFLRDGLIARNEVYFDRSPLLGAQAAASVFGAG